MYKKIVLNIFVLIAALCVCGNSMATEEEQIVTPSQNSFSVNAGDVISFDLTYSTTDETLSGLGLTLHFDSSKLEFKELSDVLSTNKLAEDSSAQDDSENKDNNADTDKRITVAWADMGSNWPGTTSVILYSVSFTVKESSSASTMINITGSPAAGCSFSADSVTINFEEQEPPVEDNPPVVKAPADLTIEATGQNTTVNISDLGTAIVTDDIDISLTAIPTIDGAIAPFSLGLGSYPVTWTATDRGLNTGFDTQTLVIQDTTPPTVNPPADITVEATGSITNVSLGSASAFDLVDGDLLPVPDNSGSFTVGTHTIKWNVSDNSGNPADTASQTVSVVDTTPPIVTANDITVDSTGSVTQIDTGIISCVDLVDDNPALSGEITYADGTKGQVTEQILNLPTGAHTITWTAIDNYDNTASVTQKINVIPKISFTGKKQTVGLGDTAQTITVGVALNGYAASYPVTMSYTIDSTSTAYNPEDHNAAAGTITIDSGTRGEISFQVEPGPLSNGQNLADIYFNMGTLSNAIAGKNSEYQVVLKNSGSNSKPRVRIKIKDISGKTVQSIVAASTDLVTVEAIVKDQNHEDTHTYDWTCTDGNCLTSDSSDSTWTIDPSDLTQGIYLLKVKVTDSAGESSPIARRLLRVTGTDTTQVVDSDEDCIPDSMDNIDEPNILQGKAGANHTNLLLTQPGLVMRLGTTAYCSDNGAGVITLDQIGSYGGESGGQVDNADPGNFSFKSDIFDFEIDELDEPGDTVQVVLPLSYPVPNKGVYRKYSNKEYTDGTPSGWRTFEPDGINQIHSAITEDPDGVCPDPGDSCYEEGLLPGRYCIQLTIKDGGIYDTDGQEDGHISDPGGVAEEEVPQDPDDEDEDAGSGGGCFIDSAAYDYEH